MRRGQQTVVNKDGRQLLWSQATRPTIRRAPRWVQAKQGHLQRLANSMQQQDPAVYPLFQGQTMDHPAGIAFAAMFAALVAELAHLADRATLIVSS